jgi:hypothetical protein
MADGRIGGNWPRQQLLTSRLMLEREFNQWRPEKRQNPKSAALQQRGAYDLLT